MSVHRRSVLVLVVKLAKITQISADVLGGYRRILPPLPGVRLSRYECRRAEAGFTHGPEMLLLGPVNDEPHVRSGVVAREPGSELLGSIARLVARGTTEFDEQPPGSTRQERKIFPMRIGFLRTTS